MQATRFTFAAAALTLAFAAHAESPLASGSEAAFAGTATRAQVQSELAQYRKTGVNTYASAYNPAATFRGERTRAEVEAEFIANRDVVKAMTGEDSGSFWLAQHRTTIAAPVLAGEPALAAPAGQ